MKNITSLIILFFIFSTVTSFSQTIATYDVTFNSIWNATDHSSVPGSAHWSKLVGATHKTANSFIELGSLSTTGIKNIAETGNNSVFISEVNSAIMSGETDQYINGPSLGSATGDMLISNLEVSQSFPLLTLVSMIAPSPDWMIAVNGYNLLDLTDNWKTSVTLDLFAYDAGTDSGTNYSSPNLVTTPFQPISMINGFPLLGNKIGTLTITLKTITSVSESLVFNNLKIYPNPVIGNNMTISNLEGTSNLTAEIMTITGSIIKTSFENVNNNSISIDTQNLSSGIYLLRLVTEENDTVIRKFIVE